MLLNGSSVYGFFAIVTVTALNHALATREYGRFRTLSRVPAVRKIMYGLRLNPTRREVLQAGAGTIGAVFTVAKASAAADFWNRKTASAWSNEEIARLTTHSPWARDVNAEFELDSDYTTNGAEGPSVGRGGALGAPGAATGGAAQIELGRDKNNAPRGARRGEPVIVRWESAQPVLDALGVPLPEDFTGRYVLSVSGLPLGVMERRKRGEGERVSVDPQENTPAARQRRMVEELQSSATLDAKGREPAQAGLVRPVPRTPGTYLFGFSKELLPLTANDREVVFTLKTALMSVKAKFEPKEMMYRGHLAL